MARTCIDAGLVPALALVSTLPLAGCGPKIPQPSKAGPDMPRISWVIMSGDRDNPDQDYVCQSDPRDACAVHASRADEQVFGHVHVYYHPSAVETKYSGSVVIGFFQGEPASKTLSANVSLKPGDKVGNQTVVGIVTQQPGTYPVQFAVTATPSGQGQPQTIRDEVNVSVQ